MSKPVFERMVIGELENEVGPAPMNTLFNIADLNGDGLPDIFTTGRDGRMAWFENPGAPGPWTRHIIAEVERQECGGLAYDLTGNGRLDIINGGDWRSDQVSWWENPAPADGHWKRYLIAETGAGQFHDEMIGDVTGDGNLSLIFANQKGATLYRVPLPAEPRVSPWPNIEVIARDLMTDGLPEEGIALADIDGDGVNEIVAGTHWFKWERGRWAQYKYADHYITTLIAVGDIDGDGELEIVLSEGDPCIYGHPEGGKVGWFKRGADIRQPWTEHRITENLLDPHSLQLGDICGNGRLDILIGEISVKDKLEENPPRLFVFENDGRGGFVRHLVDEGVGTHHARLTDLQGTGKLDIVSRPLHGPDKWKIFAWYRK